MKKTFINTTSLLAIAAFFFCSAFTTPEALRWEKLGMRIVNYGLDRDEIPVTLAEGAFTSVKLIVNHAPIQLHRFVIHFSNGSTQEVWVRRHIPRGGETRIIDLDGGKRGIKKIVFWYETRKLARGKALIELWGQH